MKSYKTKSRSAASSFESEENLSLPKKIVKETKTQLGPDKFGKNIIDQIFGTNMTEVPDFQPNADLAPSQPVKRTEIEKNTKIKTGSLYEIFSIQTSKISKDLDGERKTSRIPRQEIRPGIEYHRQYFDSITNSDKNFMHRESGEHRRQVQQIMDELKKLITTTKALRTEFGHISMQTAPIDPGKYYISFFEWMILMIRQAKQKVEDSKSWLDAMKGKNAKKLGYWGKAKKFGTSFSQANERNVATSTG